VGAGITGLAAALRLTERPEVDVLVLEGSADVGGKLRAGSVAGVPVDVGGEALLARRPEAVDLARRVGLADALTHPAPVGAGLWARERLRRFPRPMVQGVPADLRDLADTGILAPTELARAAAEPGLPSRPVPGDVSVGRFVRERLGQAVVDRLVEPLLGGVYAGRADELSWRACLPQLAAALDGGSLVAAARRAAETARATRDPAQPVFAGVDGGVHRLVDATRAAVERSGARIRTECMARELTRTTDGWRLVCGPTRSPELVDADAVLLATPAAATARLLASVAPYAAADLAGIDYASMAIVTLAVRRDEPLPGSGFLAASGSLCAVKGATFSSTKWPWLAAAAGAVAPGLVLARASVGRRGDEALLQHPDSELVQLATADLAHVLGASGQRLGEPVAATVTRWGGGLPQYGVGHLDRVARIRDQVARLAGLAVAGAAYEGVGVPACIASAERAVTTLTG